MSALVLVVEDEPILGRNVRTYLTGRGYRAELAPTLAAARKAWIELHPDLILLDHNLPDGIGIRLIEEIRAVDAWTKIVMITAHGGVNLAVTAMKAGADDYLTKPVALDEIGLLAGRLMVQARRDGSARYLTRRDQEASSLDRLVGTSPVMGEIRRRIRALQAAEVAQAPVAGPAVLVLGETGTGKELVARAIHFGGTRATEPFISVNCATLAEPMFDLEFFGHERGAFAGADERHLGLAEAAHCGTLFLDEVAALTPALQAKLLKVLEDGQIRMIGAVLDRQINVRVIAATNAPLADVVRDGSFRADLYYRLAQVVVDLPPLRKRGHDVLQIAETIIAELQARLRRPKLHLTQTAQAALLRHSWPGNIRELRNVLEQAGVLSARDAIEAADLGLIELSSRTAATGAAANLAPAPADTGESSLGDVERALIIGALRQHGGNVTLASQALGISRDTLRYRMEKHALKRDFYLG